MGSRSRLRSHGSLVGVPGQSKTVSGGRQRLVKRFRWLAVLSVLPILAILHAGSAYAQGGADREPLSNPSGAGMPHATVTVANPGTGVDTVVAANGTGNLTIPTMILGDYTLKVEKSGFRAHTHPGSALTAGGLTYTANVALEPGAVIQAVEHKAAAPGRPLILGQGATRNNLLYCRLIRR